MIFLAVVSEDNFFLFSVGPDVALDNQYLDMGVVESGKFVAKSFKILNNTEVPAAFQVNYQKFRKFCCCC